MTPPPSSSTPVATAVRIREAVPADAGDAGRICHEAFASIAARHGFPADVPDAATGVGFVSMLLAHPRFHGVVAERDGRVVGSNFLDERSHVAGVGPITVDPALQDAGVGRQLMHAVLERARRREFDAVRLLQSTYHRRSMSLYAKLGFDVRDLLAVFAGTPGAAPDDRPVRAGRETDRAACNALCVRVHGHDRAGEIDDALAQGLLRVVERGGEVVGYAASIGFFGHAVGETWQDVAALIAAAGPTQDPGIIVPTRDAPLFRWCLAGGLRIVQPLTLMTIGPYVEPRGAWMPSILY